MRMIAVPTADAMILPGLRASPQRADITMPMCRAIGGKGRLSAAMVKIGLMGPQRSTVTPRQKAMWSLMLAAAALGSG